MIKELNSLFPTGTRISNKELKIRLQQLYKKYGIAAVAKAVDTILTILFPIKTVEINFEKDSAISSVFLALKSSLLAQFLSLILFNEEKAVSAEEKNPDANNKITKIRGYILTFI